MSVSPVIRFVATGAIVATALTVLRYTIGGWYDDMPNTLAAFGSAGLLGGAIGGYIAVMTRKYGQLRAVTPKP